MADDQQLTTALKKRLQQLRAASCQNPAANFYPMVQLRMIQYLHHRLHRARLGVIRAIYQAFNAGMHQRSCAHGARLNCSKHLTVAEAMIPHRRAGLAQGHDFRMGRRIAVADVAVPSAPNYASGAHDHRPNRNLSSVLRSLRGAERFFHPKLVQGKPVLNWLIPKKLLSIKTALKVFVSRSHFPSGIANVNCSGTD